jgi:hypothetical protein
MEERGLPGLHAPETSTEARAVSKDHKKFDGFIYVNVCCIWVLIESK